MLWKVYSTKPGLAITGAWRGTNRDKIYKELGWESLQNRRWLRRLSIFYKIMNGLTPKYMSDPVPEHLRHLYGVRTSNVIRPLRFCNDRFQNCILWVYNIGKKFDYCIKYWEMQ